MSDDMTQRTAKLSRETGETRVSVELNVDGKGRYQVDTGNGMFDHLLAQLSRHGLIDLDVAVKGDSEVGWHHIVEDTAIVVGRALRQAVGDGLGITRMSHAVVPLDEAAALVAVDFSGRGYAVVKGELTDGDMGGLTAHLVVHFLETMAREGGFNVHVRLLTGDSGHHNAEVIFKALARAMRAALTLDERLEGEAPSTKGTISS